MGTPFLDRGLERRAWKRPVAKGLFSLIVGGLALLGSISYYDDAHNPAVARQLALQAQQTAAYMKRPFQPQLAETSPVGTAASVAASTPGPETTVGQKIFDSHSCYACHGQGGAGSPMAPRLAGIGSKYSAEQLLGLFNHPTAAMDSRGMPHFQFSQSEVKALIAYLDSQH